MRILTIGWPFHRHACRLLAASLLLLAVAGIAQASDADPRDEDLLARYGTAIRQSLLEHWVHPDTVPAGQRCRLLIRQLPGGDVLDVDFAVDCPYDAEGRRALEQAVLRAQPLPYRGFERVFQRTLTLNFEAPGG